MRFLFIGKNHGFSLLPLRAIAEGHELVGLVESGPRSVKRADGTVDVPPAPPPGSGLQPVASEAGVPYLFLTGATRHELAPFVRAAQPDLICVASMSQLLPAEVLAIPTHGAINLHPSALPKYRGAFPWFWQYYHFEKEIGIAVHFIDADEGVDRGAILEMEMLPVPLGKDVRDLVRETEPIGARLMRAAVDALERGDASPTPQPPGEYPTARVVHRHERLIDWAEWPLERVWHVMRGTHPWMDPLDYPGGMMKNARWKIGEMERTPAPGHVGRVGRDLRGWYAGHREGRIRLRPRLSWRRRIRNLVKRV